MLKEDRLYTIDEVAARYRVTVFAVREWIKTGRLDAIKPMQQYLISKSALEAFEKAAKNDRASTN